MSELYFRSDSDPTLSLARTIERDRRLLETLSTYDGPLTIEALSEIDPRLAEPAEQLAQTPLLWPDETSAVSVPFDSPVRSLSGDGADQAFVTPIATRGSGAYNNYFAIIGSEPVMPSEQALKNAMNRGLLHVYGSKPYLVRAHALLPEFMGSLQRSVELSGGMQRYSERLLDSYIDPEFNTDEAALLTGSRIAYVLLTRLMREDDLHIHHSMLHLPQASAGRITDPTVELHT